MKTLLIGIFGMGIVLTSCAQQSTTPQVVKDAFNKQFPGAEEVKWNKEGVNFEASFEKNEKDMSAVIDAKGNVLETEVGIEINELPQAVQDYLAKNYAGKKINEAAKIVNAKGTLTYEAEIDKSDVLFDSNGNFIKVSKD
ncbi:MAG: PepSY-like domain-containing protein [Crocinitomicaceae bacterium]